MGFKTHDESELEEPKDKEVIIAIEFGCLLEG